MHICFPDNSIGSMEAIEVANIEMADIGTADTETADIQMADIETADTDTSDTETADTETCFTNCVMLRSIFRRRESRSHVPERINTNTLPNECLALVFKLLTLTQLCIIVRVCRHWRIVAEGTPTLWKTINYIDKHNQHVEHFCRVLCRAFCLSKLKIVMRNVDVDLFDILTTNCILLKELDISRSEWKFGRCIKKIGTRCKNLEILELQNTFPIDDDAEGFLHLAKLPKLVSLNINYCTWVTDEFIMALATCKCHLEILNMNGVETFSSESFILLIEKHKTTLNRLHIQGTNLSNEAFSVLSKCKNLKHLSITCASSLDTAFTEIGKLPLEILSVKDAKHISNFTYIETFNLYNFSSLEGLDLTKSNINDDALICLAKKTPNLTVLCLSESTQITDLGINVLVNHCTKLRELLLCNVPAVTVEVFVNIVTKLKNLEGLSLIGTTYVSDDDIVSTIVNRPKLKVLNCMGKTIRHDDLEDDQSFCCKCFRFLFCCC